MSFKSCEVCRIKSRRVSNEKRIFMAKFPLDEARCKQWVKQVGNSDLAFLPIEKLHMLKYVCGKHFKPTDFNKKKTQLKKNAVPSVHMTREPLREDVLKDFPLHIISKYEQIVSSVLHVGSMSTSKINVLQDHNYCLSSMSKEIEKHSPGSIFKLHVLKDHDYCMSAISEESKQHSQDPSTSTAGTSFAETIFADSEKNKENIDSMSDKSPTPRKNKLIKLLRKYKHENTTLRKKMKEIEDIDSPILKILLETSKKNHVKRPHGKRWSELNKSVALSIYEKSPTAFKYLRQLLPMPSIRTLQFILQNMKLEPGLDPVLSIQKKIESSSD